METEGLLLALLHCAIGGTTLKEETSAFCTAENLEAVYELARKHDLAHLAAHAVEGLELPECDALKKLKNAKLKAIYRYAKMDYEYERLRDILENAKIPFIPMKGIITREYYPEPWMRTSCDIDILVGESDLKRAADILSENQWSIRGEINHHDVHMQTAGGVHLDLHYSIKGNIDAPDAVLDRVWDYSVPAENRIYEQRQTNEFFLYHLIAHTSRHLLSEGCGIRPFLDLWLLRKRMPYEQESLQKLCVDAKLETFWQYMQDLSDVWFEGKDHTEITRGLERYVLNRDKEKIAYNAAVFQQALSKRSAHWGSRLFLSYDLLKTTYPVLEKHRYLLPFFQIVRWFKKLTDGRIQRMRRTQQVKQTVHRKDVEDARQFLCELGLNQ